jgi:hypothetical protein
MIMPRETVRDQSGVAAQVVWSPDQHVQLATLSTNPKEFVEWCRLLVERADAAKANWGDPAQLTDVGSLGMFWTPDRYQINALIRHLRRARNAAFGADE